MVGSRVGLVSSAQRSAILCLGWCPGWPYSNRHVQNPLHLRSGWWGKSTYAAKLAVAAGAFTFSMDQWMQGLFGADIPKSDGITGVDFAWFAERVDRCEAQIWQVARQVLSRGDDVIFDWGFIRRARRDKAAEVAASGGYATQWHVVDAPCGTRRGRVTLRNEQGGETYAFAVTPAMFDFAEQLFESPDQAELSAAIWTTT